MTKKDYRAIAEAISRVRTGTHANLSKDETLRFVIIALGDVFRADNANYQHAKFEEACK